MLLNKEYYLQESYKILNVTNYYRRLKDDPTEILKKQLESLVTRGFNHGVLNKMEKEYLYNNNPATPYFYILPKIKKILYYPRERPIIAGVESLTSHLGEYVDRILQPYITSLSSYLRDSGQLLAEIGDLRWNENMWLVTLDVVSLYSNIPEKRGVQVVADFLKEDLIFN